MTLSLPRPLALRMTREEAETITGGKWQGQQRDVTIYGACIDSRQVRPGALFCCLDGQHVDGHDYAATAVGDGAACVLASRSLDVPVPVLVVKDVAAAMAAFAKTFRKRYPGAKWIGVTGSNGKTTVKEMLRGVFGRAGNIHSTIGNYNNHLGVPLTVLATPPNCDYVIVELGASAEGEINDLADIVQPDCGIITTIGPAHLEGFGGIAGVARGKSELFKNLKADGVALFCENNLDQTCAEYGSSAEEVLGIVQGAAGERRLISIGDAEHPVAGSDTERGQSLQTPVGEVDIQFFGQHNLANALLCWYAAVAMGMSGEDARDALAHVSPVAGRLLVHHCAGHHIYDDSYNANPGSMYSGLQVLARQYGARLAVLGQMGELGADSEALHKTVGRQAARFGVPLLTIGAGAQAIGAGYTATGARDYEHVDSIEDALPIIFQRLRIGPHSILVKASRSAGLEAVVHGLLDELNEGDMN